MSIDPATKRAIVRLATEGVPVRPIARAFGISADVAWGVVVRAFRDQGKFQLPSDEWPQAVQVVDRAATVQVKRALKGDPGNLVGPLRRTFGVTEAEADALVCLLSFFEASHAMLHAAISGEDPETQRQVVPVIVSKLRRKLPSGMTIRTIPNFGYAIDEPVADLIFAALAERAIPNVGSDPQQATAMEAA